MSAKSPKSASQTGTDSSGIGCSNFFPKRVETLQCRPPTEPYYVHVIHITVFSLDAELKLAVAQGYGANKINSLYHRFHNMIIFQMFVTENLLVNKIIQ